MPIYSDDQWQQRDRMAFLEISTNNIESKVQGNKEHIQPQKKQKKNTFTHTHTNTYTQTKKTQSLTQK